MILGIDASNIRTGGGLTHLVEILTNIDAENLGFSKIVVWSSKRTLSVIPDKEYIIKKSNLLISFSSLTTFLWQLFYMAHAAKKEACDLVFAPGGTFVSGFKPFVTMSQNMLPFEKNEALRFETPFFRFKLWLLNKTQSYSFEKSEGIIFLTAYAKNVIEKSCSIKNKKKTIIPHGINPSFIQEPKMQKEISEYNKENPFRILYVSIVTAYKHQWNVVEAISLLRQEGYPVALDLIGSATKDGFRRLNKKISEVDPSNEFVTYHGFIEYDLISSYYKASDAFVFASSCENLPNILNEAMAAGLPIACSDRGPMPEILADGGFYFNPENVNSIVSSIKKLLINAKLRQKKAEIGHNYSSRYDWKDCSIKTFHFLRDIASNTESSFY